MVLPMGSHRMARTMEAGVSEQGVEVWRGSCNAWECDEMGHMNVRFYLARAHEGLVGLMAALGLEGAFGPGAEATAVVSDHHVRFIREARAGAPLHMRAGVLTIGEDEARLLQLIVHGRTGEIAAAIQSLVRHVTAREGRPFPWSRRTCELARSLAIETPAAAAPRSLGLAPSAAEASAGRADALGLARSGAGAFGPAEVDVFGRVRPDAIIGRISDAVPNLGVRAARRGARRQAGGRRGPGISARLPRGRARRRSVRIRSGLIGADSRLRRLVHWIVDPTDGKAWASTEAVAVALDLDARRIIELDAEARARLAAEVVAGLAF